MSALLLPNNAPVRTRRAVTQCLMEVPTLTRFLDTHGLLTALCLKATDMPPDARRDFLLQASATSHRMLAQKLGLPSLKILRRLTGDALHSANMSQLASLLLDSRSLVFLRHARYVSAALIQSLATEDLRHQMGKAFIVEIGRALKPHRPTSEELLEMGYFLREFLPRTTLVSLKQFISLWNEYFELIECHQLSLRKRNEFPAPPWPDEPGYVTAIRSWSELIADSIQMRNGVGTTVKWSKEIWRGRGCYFRIEESWDTPRATLYCVRGPRHWRIGEVWRPRYALVTSQDLRSLASWLAEKQSLDDETHCLPRPNYSS